MENLNTSAVPIHPMLRFAVSTFFWFFIVGVQYLWNKHVVFRYMEDPAAQLVDIMSICNISCVIWDANYHLYYIHGKSVHARADASLEEIHHQLQREARNWTSERGLLPGKDTFQVYASHICVCISTRRLRCT